MKRVWPILPVALVVSGAVYAVLAAVRPAARAIEDPWYASWTMSGLKVQSRSVSTDPEKHLHLIDARPLARGPQFAGTVLRSYFVQSVSTQVVEFPSAALLAKEIPEGRSMNYRVVKGGGTAHVCRVGRFVLAVSVQQRTLLGAIPVPPDTVTRVIEVFEDAARGSR